MYLSRREACQVHGLLILSDRSSEKVIMRPLLLAVRPKGTMQIWFSKICKIV